MKKLLTWCGVLIVSIQLSACFDSNRQTSSEPLGTSKQALSGAVDFWIASASEKVRRGSIPSWLTTTNRKVWDGSTIHLFGARNEVVAFQVLMKSTQSITAMNLTLSSLVKGSDKIENTSSDATSSVGRPIQLYEQKYLYVDRASGGPNGSLFWGANAEPTGFAGKFVPDPLVPFEVNVAKNGHPFSLQANTLQGVWADIYIPKGLPAGTYTGTVTILADGNVKHTIPVSLQVHCFTLPDKPTAKTMLYIDIPEVYWRHGTQEGTPEATTLLKRYYQMLHRHKISPIETLTTTTLANTRSSMLNGTAFTNAQGYAGPGESTGTGVFSVSTYGAWFWAGYDENTIQQKADEWANWLSNNHPTVDSFLYVVDEPSSSSDSVENVLNFCMNLKEHGGPGSNLPRLVTAPFSPAFAIGIDTWVAPARSYNSETTVNACTLKQKAWIYNGYRPNSGVFVLDAEGVSPRVNGWIQYKHAIPRWYSWMGNYWSDWQGGRGRLDPFVVSENFRNAWGEWGVGDGTLFYPGTQVEFPANNFDFPAGIPSIRLKNWRRGIQDYEYLALAHNVNPTATANILQNILPASLSQADASGNASWSIRGDAWEVARKQLANIIENSCTGGGSGPGAPVQPPSNTAPPVCTIPKITVQDGDWSNPSTWEGGTLPTSSDLIIIAHNVIVDTATTAGTTPADNTTQDILVLGPTGSLQVAKNTTFTVRGNIFLSMSTMTLLEGSTLEFDVPVGKRYQLKIGMANDQNAILNINGVQGNRAHVRSKAGGGIVQMLGGQTFTGDQTGGWRNGGQIHAVYTTFTRIGDATHPAHQRYPGLTSSTFIFDHCIMDTCGDWSSTVFDGLHANVEFLRTSFKNSQAARSLHISHWGTATPNGTRRVEHCAFDKPVHFYTGSKYTIKDNYFAQAFVMSPGIPAVLSGNLIRKTSNLAIAIPAAGLEIKNNYWLNDTTTPYAQMIAPVGNGSTTPATRIVENLFEYTSSDKWGSGIIFGTFPSSAGNVDVHKNIMIPNAAGQSPGSLMILQGSSHLTVNVQRNTYMMDSLGLFIGLGYLGHSGMISAFRNNLAWAPFASGANFAIYNLGGTWTATDVVSAGNLDYNNSYLNQPGSNGNGYHMLSFSSGTPGVHDKHVNPQFVDSTRKIEHWVASLGGNGATPAARLAYGLEQIARMNDDSVNDDYTIQALIAYVRGGFAPTNTQLRDSGAPVDGTPDIGAVDVVVP